jgi:hypothetical protein
VIGVDDVPVTVELLTVNVRGCSSHPTCSFGCGLVGAGAPSVTVFVGVGVSVASFGALEVHEARTETETNTNSFFMQDPGRIRALDVGTE